MNKFSRLPFFALLLAMILWGSSYVAFKYTVMIFDPVVVVFGRLFVSGLLFFLFFMWKRPQPIRTKDMGLMLFMALCEPCFYFLLEGKALTLTTASQAGMVAAILPVLVALASGFFLGEMLTRRAWVGLLLALVGVAWVSVAGEATETAPDPLVGNILEFGAMLFAAGYTISMKKLCRLYSSWFLTAVQSCVGAVFFFPLLLLPTTRMPETFPLAPCLAVLYLGVGVSIGAYGLYNYGVSKLPAWQASAFVNLIPAFSILLGWACLGERMNGWQLLGVGLVFCGVLCSQGLERHRKTALEIAGREDPSFFE